jgi:hypothetical protein
MEVVVDNLTGTVDMAEGTIEIQVLILVLGDFSDFIL